MFFKKVLRPQVIFHYSSEEFPHVLDTLQAPEKIETVSQLLNHRLGRRQLIQLSGLSHLSSWDGHMDHRVDGVHLKNLKFRSLRLGPSAQMAHRSQNHICEKT